MPYEAPGIRVRIAAAAADRIHGTFTVEGNRVGYVVKNSQAPGVFSGYDPTDQDAVRHIEAGEGYELMIGGVHEVAVGDGTGGTAPAATALNDLLWIDPDDGAIKRHANRADGDLPLGVVDEIDATRTPDVARVNLNALAGFFPADVA
jgi:hypothetical protein